MMENNFDKWWNETGSGIIPQIDDDMESHAKRVAKQAILNINFMIRGENQLTEEKKKILKQGTKVEFKWHGSESLYTGRIEVDKYGRSYFINEHCFEGDKLREVDEPMRYYNDLESFFFFTYFEVLS